MKIVGAEVLLRWHSEILGHVSPAEFIPIAECAGKIDLITEWIFERSGEQFTQFVQHDLSNNFLLSINISSMSIKKTGFFVRLNAVF